MSYYKPILELRCNFIKMNENAINPKNSKSQEKQDPIYTAQELQSNPLKDRALLLITTHMQPPSHVDSKRP
jgi:hypothetical protein